MTHVDQLLGVLASRYWMRATNPAVRGDQEGQILTGKYNRVGTDNAARHPQLALARRAARHLAPEQRQQATM